MLTRPPSFQTEEPTFPVHHLKTAPPAPWAQHFSSRYRDFIGSEEARDNLSGYSQLYTSSAILFPPKQNLNSNYGISGSFLFLPKPLISPWNSFVSVSQLTFPEHLSWCFCEIHQFLRVILTSQGFLLLLSFYSSFLSFLGKYVFQTSFPSHCFLLELMNIYTLPLLSFHSHTYFSPLPQLHISWGKLDYSLHPIVIDRHSSSYPLKPVLIY